MALTREEVLGRLRERLDRFEKMYGVTRIGLFGSVARGETNELSDMDILVEMRSPTFDNYMDLKFEIESDFGVPVDLVLADTVKERLRPIIEQEVSYA